MFDWTDFVDEYAAKHGDRKTCEQIYEFMRIYLARIRHKFGPVALGAYLTGLGYDEGKVSLEQDYAALRYYTDWISARQKGDPAKNPETRQVDAAMSLLYRPKGGSDGDPHEFLYSFFHTALQVEDLSSQFEEMFKQAFKD